MELKFIPVRGRKRAIRALVIDDIFVEIYPREGTETTDNFFFAPILPLKFIPVRGRKRVKRDNKDFHYC